MAFLYDTGFKRTVSNSLFKVSDWDSGELVIQIFSGTQPSDADFLTNWSTTYYYNNSNGATGSAVLGTYGDILNSNVATDIMTVTANGGNSFTDSYTWSVDDLAHKKTWFANGTATWGVVWKATEFQTAASATTPYADSYIIGPVSGSGGTGMIKLASTTITDPIPDFEDLSIDITMA